MLIVEWVTPSHKVSYFDHERQNSPNTRRAVKEIINHGFDTVIICVSEKTLNDPKKLEIVGKMVKQSRAKGLTCWADPWTIGKVFGGEGESPFVETGERPCFCHDRFNNIMNKWVDTVAQLGFTGVFWDEPETKCPDHTEVDLVRPYSEKAKAYGLSNAVCLPADERKLDILEGLAALPSIDDIAVDPYWPNAFTKIAKEQRDEYVATWADRVLSLASTYGKSCHLWLQGFDLKRDDVGMIREFAAVMQARGVNDWAFWGYRGCESVFGKKQENASPKKVWKEAKHVFTKPHYRRTLSA